MFLKKLFLVKYFHHWIFSTLMLIILLANLKQNGKKIPAPVLFFLGEFQ